MLTNFAANNPTVRIRRLLSVWSVALAIGWAAAAVAGPAKDLFDAASRGDMAAAQALLHRGANVNAKKNGNTALMLASIKGHLDVVRALLDKGAEVNARSAEYGMTALMLASDAGHLYVVQALLDKGAEVNAKDNRGGTALMIASFKGNLDVVRALLDMGPRPMPRRMPRARTAA